MGGEVVIVAVDASKESSNNYALEWAIQNVTKAEDFLILLAVLPPNLNRRRRSLACYFLWCGKRHNEGSSFDVEQRNRSISHQINNVYGQKMQQLWLANNLMKVQYKVQVIINAHLGSVATKAREFKASWVILDRVLKKEADHCTKQLNCNVVLMDHDIPRILKAVAGENFSESRSQIEPTESDMLDVIPNIIDYKIATTPSSNSDITSSTFGTYTFSSSSSNKEYKFKTKTNPPTVNNSDAFLYLNSECFEEDSEYLERLNPSPSDSLVQAEILITRRDSMTPSSSAIADRNSIIRKTMPLSITSPPNPPALCSICKNHKKPILRNAARKFTYREIERAIDGFSNTNFMSESGYGCLYRGELPDAQFIAVKQYKKLKAVAASEFCSEVERLICLQHRNLLMLVGYCIDIEWLLIYEFPCNGSLDNHIYGTETNKVMGWHDRMKVAVGTARGLRYLHEDCRAGCIVHRNLKPSNIFLTHDFEPMIGDFGLASWQLNAQLTKETHLIGKFCYLSPEYIQTGQVTEKADVYAFGVILLELLSGFKAMEWGSTMLEKKKTKELIDSRLYNNYVEREAECMMHAAYLCISPHPEQRPRMSQVLKILEGDFPTEGAQCSKIFNNGSINRTKDYMKLSQIEGNGITWEFESATSLDYESYLRGSLAKFVQNLN